MAEQAEVQEGQEEGQEEWADLDCQFSDVSGLGTFSLILLIRHRF